MIWQPNNYNFKFIAQAMKSKESTNKLQKKKDPSSTKPVIIRENKIPFFEKWEEILRGQQRKVLLGIVLLSIFIKSIYFYQAAATKPIFNFQEWNQCDMNFFTLWADNILQGDVLTEKELHPNHIWEIKTANYYFANNPDQYKYYLEKNNGQKDSIALSQLLWNHWFQGKTFHQEPLYAYFIAGIYKIFGHDVRWVFLWQIILGIAVNVLVLKIGTHYFGHLAGLISALLVTFCGPVLVYDLVLIRSTLTVFFTLLLVFSLLKTLQNQSFSSYFMFGMVCSLAYLNQAYTLAFFVLGLGILYSQSSMNFTRKLKLLTVGIVSFLIFLLPLIYRNIKVGAPTMSVAGHGAVVFVTGNQKGVEPTQIFVVDSMMTATVLGKTDAKMLPSIVESIKSQDSFLDYLQLLVGKFFAIFHWVEIHNNINFYFYQHLAPILSWCGVTNFILAPMGLVGLALAFRRYRFQLLPLYAMLCISFLPMIIGLVFARFRVNLLVILVLFSGFLIVEIFKYFAQNNVKKWHWVGLLILTFVITSNYRTKPFSKVQAWEYLMTYNLFFEKEIKENALLKKPEKCIDLIDTFLDFRPSFLDKLNANNRTDDIEEKYIAYFFINIYEMKAKFLRGMKQELEAQTFDQKVLDLRLTLTDFDANNYQYFLEQNMRSRYSQPKSN
jgi:4-amino-4-deoxy-L-arabinose transferase-like glycosyltransferase